LRGLTELEMKILRRGLRTVLDYEWIDSDVVAADELDCCGRLIKRGLLREEPVEVVEPVNGVQEWVVLFTTDLGRLALRLQDPSP